MQSYHLGGMGCANGVVAVNLVRDLLQAHPNSNAVLLTTETTTPAYYPGRDKHRQITNLLFRCAGSQHILPISLLFSPAHSGAASCQDAACYA
jgi:3-ketoacyl-CoA synthase